MAGSDALVTVAEVAIALAGFSAVVAVFRRTQGAAWTPAEVNGLWIMMEVSFGLIFLSLLPLALEQTALAGKLLWAVACVVLGTFTALDPRGMAVPNASLGDPSKTSLHLSHGLLGFARGRTGRAVR